jgi:aspartate beta-hydroxylase
LDLFISGKKIDKNCLKTPFTCSLLEQIIPASKCSRGQIKFSLLSPGTHIWPHCGPTNTRLRAHLGLSIPTGARIRVATEERVWENGKILIFDDSFEHEVWHEGDQYRLILIVDFWHPDLNESERAQLSAI